MGNFILELGLELGAWLLLAGSVFNMLIMLWLGMTIFFTAEHRSRGAYLILSGMLSGSLFFTSHSVLLGDHLVDADPVLASDFWWQVGWVPVILSPLLWYLVMLWYTGLWDATMLPLFRQHRLRLLIAVGYAACLLGLSLYTNFRDGAVPMLILFYPPYVLLTILLSFDTLNHAQPSQRMMGDLARARAHRWLMRVCGVLLIISILVTAFVYGVVITALHQESLIRSEAFIYFVEVFDLIVTLLIAAMTVMLGQAVISYEIFTGKTLPRRGFQRLWRNAMIVCATTAGFISFSFLLKLPYLHSLLLFGVMLVTFFGLLGWRTFVHRDHLIKRLRPITSSQGSAQYLFDIVCREMLQTEKACLLPIVPPLTDQPLYFQTHQPPPGIDWQTLRDVPIAALPDQTGYHWVIPVWSTRGLVGLLFIGHQEDSGLYTQEVIDAASASLERIIELLLREALGARVLQIERTRQMQQRILDRQAQRVLHDEVLPDLHLAILEIDDSPAREALIAAHRKISDLMHSAHQLPGQAMQSPDVIAILQAIVEDEFSHAFDDLQWQGAAAFLIQDAFTREVVVHAAREAMRNAAKYGRGADSNRKLCLTISAEPPALLTITDDGVGQLQPWQKTNGGLVLHSTMLAIVGGDFQVGYPVAGGTRVTIRFTPGS